VVGAVFYCPQRLTAGGPVVGKINVNFRGFFLLAHLLMCSSVMFAHEEYLVIIFFAAIHVFPFCCCVRDLIQTCHRASSSRTEPHSGPPRLSVIESSTHKGSPEWTAFSTPMALS
jgi:hypothetical protein